MLDFSQEHCLEMISAWFQFADGWDKYLLETLGNFLEGKIFKEKAKPPFSMAVDDFPEAEQTEAADFINEWNDFQEEWKDYLPFFIPFAKGEDKRARETSNWFHQAENATGTNIGGNFLNGSMVNDKPDWIDRARKVGLDFYYLDSSKADSSLVMFSPELKEENNGWIKMTFSLAKKLIKLKERKCNYE